MPIMSCVLDISALKRLYVMRMQTRLLVTPMSYTLKCCDSLCLATNLIQLISHLFALSIHC